MNFFGLGPLEIVVVAVLALIFIGPERLPGVMRQIFGAYRQLRSLGTEWREEVERQVGGDLRALTSEINQGLDSFNQSIESQITAVDAEIREAQQEVTQSLNPPQNLPLLPPATPEPVAEDDEAPRSIDYTPR